MAQSNCSIFCAYLLALFEVLILGPFMGSSALGSVTSDSVFYHIAWPGPLSPHSSDINIDDNSVLMSTSNKEQYRCSIPPIQRNSDFQNDMNHYTGKSPRELLQPLFSLKNSCSYRIESYWTYELCHGKHLRQYHEEKESGKQTKLQQYYLGYHTSESIENKETEDISMIEIRKRSITLDNADFPYVQVNITGGTKCDITNEPRQARLLYICHNEGKGEIYEIKETSSCHYDVIVLTSLLCSHPAFKMQVAYSNKIQCYSMQGTSRRPLSLDTLELESAKHKVPIAAEPILEAQSPVKRPVKVQETVTHPGAVKNQDDEIPPPAHTPENIMSGSYCFTGGSGWWHHELCLGRFVQQFRSPAVNRRTGQRTNIVLGVWDRALHREWVRKNKEKRHEVGMDVVYFLCFCSFA